MDGSRFDAWTRRRLGLATGGALASLATLGVLTEAEAKKNKKRKKKRCRKLGASCTPGAKRKCCGSLSCDLAVIDGATQTVCCRDEDQACSDDPDCCQPLGCLDGSCRPLISDRNLKANFGSVEPADMLARVRDLPISTWNYTSDDPAIRHIGPMAQDFAATFGVGVDDRHIHPLDGQGVALAAIQGIITELDALRQENARLAERIAAIGG